MKNFALLFAFSLFLGVCLAHAGQQLPNGGESSAGAVLNTPASSPKSDSAGSISSSTPASDGSSLSNELYDGGNIQTPSWDDKGKSPFKKAPRNYLEKW